MAIKTGYPCIPTLKKSKGGGGLLIEGGHLFDIMALRVGTHWGGEREGAHLGVEGAQLGEEGRVLIWGGVLS